MLECNLNWDIFYGIKNNRACDWSPTVRCKSPDYNCCDTPLTDSTDSHATRLDCRLHRAHAAHRRWFRLVLHFRPERHPSISSLRQAPNKHPAPFPTHPRHVRGHWHPWPPSVPSPLPVTLLRRISHRESTASVCRRNRHHTRHACLQTSHRSEKDQGARERTSPRQREIERGTDKRQHASHDTWRDRSFQHRSRHNAPCIR